MSPNYYFVISLVVSLLTEIIAAPNHKEIASLLENFFERPSKFSPKNENSPTFENLTIDTRCNCVNIFQCEEFDPEETIQTETSGASVDLINIRLNPPTKDISNSSHFCSHYLEACCVIRKVGEETIVTPSKIHLHDNQCGKRNVNGVGFRVIGEDNEAQFGEFPWYDIPYKSKLKTRTKLRVNFIKMSVITEVAGTLDVYVCGAALIHPRIAITAAHCIHEKVAENLKVRVGEWDFQTNNELYPHQKLQVQQIILHPNFEIKKNLRNDVALVVLTEAANPAPNIGTVCLPSLLMNQNVDTTDCYASGWGTNSFDNPDSYQVILKKVKLPIVSKSECEKRLRRTALGETFSLHESFVCAGGREGSDTCKGDGGSPLVCRVDGGVDKPDYYTLYGLVSWGIGCGSDLPGVYVNVTKFVPWIYQSIEKLEIE